MRVLTACEYSDTVGKAFRGEGHESWTNDILPTEGNSRWHIQGDCADAIRSKRWDMIIIHIPCTAMCLAGNSTYGVGMPKHQERLGAVEWSLSVWKLACENADRVALENPASVIFPEIRKIGSDVQFIQPYQFGHMEQKKTGWALHNLPRLRETNNVFEEMMRLPKNVRERIHYMPPGPDRAKERARFFSGIAAAMADQWGNVQEHIALNLVNKQLDLFAA